VNRIILLFLFFISTFSVFSQDSQFSQFYASPLYLAPSFAGSTDGDRLSVSYRNQWPSIPNSFQTFSFSYDHYYPKLKSGLGLLILRDQAGSGFLSTTNIGVVYSYNIAFKNKWSVRPGINFMYTQRNLDFDKLIFGDDLYNENTDGSIEIPTLEKKSDIDASISVLTYNKDFWFGITMDHVLKPNRSLTGDVSQDPFKYTFFGGAKFSIFERYNLLSGQSISPSFLFKWQDEYTQLDLGLYWYQMPLVVGIWYRGIPVFKELTSNDAIAFLLGVKLDQLSIGYSYDLTISKLVGYTGGAHEISVNYLFNQGVTQRSKRRALPCPTF
jgi:type IX secretion system PorP/SprF family membrane protein